MDFEALISGINERLAFPLPGNVAQVRMSSIRRIAELARKEPKDYVKSSVLILLYPSGDEICFVVILRPDYNGVHSGQISLPGGKFEDSDKSLQFTALREVYEEIGVAPEQIQILGQLTDLYIPPSNFMVTPFIGFTRSRPRFEADPSEVAKIIEIRLSELSNRNNIKNRKVRIIFGLWIKVPCWVIDGNIIWGATAMILSEFQELLNYKG